MKKKLIIISITIACTLGIYLYFKLVDQDKNSTLTESVTPGELSKKSPKYENVQVGESNKEDVIENFGEPINEKVQGNYKVLEFVSDNPNFNNEVFFENDNAEFIKRIIVKENNINLNDYEKDLDTTKYVLYSYSSTFGTNLVVYPQSGIAFVAHTNTGIVYEIWYFEPTTLEIFKETWAKGYTEKFNPQPESME